MDRENAKARRRQVAEESAFGGVSCFRGFALSRLSYAKVLEFLGIPAIAGKTFERQDVALSPCLF
jgi:hypothetical protein